MIYAPTECRSEFLEHPATLLNSLLNFQDGDKSTANFHGLCSLHLRYNTVGQPLLRSISLQGSLIFGCYLSTLWNKKRGVAGFVSTIVMMHQYSESKDKSPVKMAENSFLINGSAAVWHRSVCGAVIPHALQGSRWRLSGLYCDGRWDLGISSHTWE
jgi:hypothetical protein